MQTVLVFCSAACDLGLHCLPIPHLLTLSTNEPRHDKTNKMSVRPAKTQISLGIRPSLIRVFAVRIMGS